MSNDVIGEGIIFSDMVIREEGTGKLTLVNLFSTFVAQGFPFQTPRFYVTVLLSNFSDFSQPVDVVFRLEEPHSGHVYSSVSGKMNFRPDVPPNKNEVLEISVQYPATFLPKQGTYFMVALVNATEVRKRAINVVAQKK